MNRYTNYKYYKGEKEPPFAGKDFGKSFWWKLESYAFKANDDKEKGMLSMTMVNYLKELMWEGDGQHDTTKEEMLRRADELYNQGLWSRSYISIKKYTLRQVIEDGN